ncbi:costars-domain-containing protein [Ephemerocybe angulata]|uniref:Costars-domain-containing protein n=1 Tax=Ephemerocybe angulata TaxID=980116 RepID=A0A8H6HC90_9AGAR|nr:costars-domain-containing protein [Tulosesus angulatus]
MAFNAVNESWQRRKHQDSQDERLTLGKPRKRRSGAMDPYASTSSPGSFSLFLSYPSTTRSGLLTSIANQLMNLNTEHEISILKKAIKDNGTVNADGKSSVSYGVLFNKTADTLEALNGTLRAAKRQKKVAFDAELLMMPKDKDVQVVLLED